MSEPRASAGVVKRSLTIRGHRTSISLEDPFWRELQSIASAKGLSLARLVADLDANRPDGTNLSSLLRVYVLEEALCRTAL
ncbi:MULTISPECIES: ribbon-helix-helix domain-containing protein [unclassified Aureimonas]|uniref:ribbon-helix-helix domain-containing protein n=1 Tax=unclassified Aureimonas TaxID=2615206 RepID=UPI0009E86368|nr:MULTISPECIES: ribbon-helix-helix domain-containing protein [unclassified Aureimonas]